MNEAGCDEAGRGCVAGPVVAAAVILPDGFTHPLLVDSKTLSEKHREEARIIVVENALAWKIAWVSPEMIDRINILNASILAMHHALDGLQIVPRHIVVDGNRFKPWNTDVDYQTVVKGDGKLANIAAASILAKTFRDDMMKKLHIALPMYAFDENKGYPTKRHLDTISAIGPSPWHRFTFKGVMKEPSLFD